LKAYGWLYYDWDRRRWVMETEPHVSLQLKRVFPKISKASMGEHELSDTPENARQLEWFFMRYPLRMYPGLEERLKQRADVHRGQQEACESLLAGTRAPEPIKLALPLREYQQLAASMMLTMRSLILADDVGLGKTASAIGMIADKRARPALVVTLTHLPHQWQAEIRKFAPGLRTHILRGTAPYKMPGGVPDVILTSYSKLAGWAETLAALGLKSITFDELQELRKPDSQRYAGAVHVRASCTYAAGLTATPIYNQGSELHAVASVIRPDALGDRVEFVREWCTASAVSGREYVADPRALGLHMRDIGLMLRRTRSDVGRELPGLTRIPHTVAADLEALERVGDACRELAQFILGGKRPERLGGQSDKGAHMLASEELSVRLRQATGIAKAPYVAEFVRLLCESGEKVLLFGWHRMVYDIWRERLADLKPRMFTGSESANEKEEARMRFCDFDTQVLMMSLRAGAGIDGLQHHCRTVVFGELDWSFGVMEQCEGRIARDGQKDPVMSYYLVADAGSDPIVSDVLNLKGGQLAGIRDPKASALEKLQSDPDRIKKLAEAYLKQIERKAKRVGT
jgi:SNF2 family DNA or RNA helicase